MPEASTYTTVAEFAQSWGLVYFFVVFVVVVILVMRPSRKRRYENAAMIPLREDED